MWKRQNSIWSRQIVYANWLFNLLIITLCLSTAFCTTTTRLLFTGTRLLRTRFILFILFSNRLQKWTIYFQTTSELLLYFSPTSNWGMIRTFHQNYILSTIILSMPNAEFQLTSFLLRGSGTCVLLQNRSNLTSQKTLVTSYLIPSINLLWLNFSYSLWWSEIRAQPALLHSLFLLLDFQCLIKLRGMERHSPLFPASLTCITYRITICRCTITNSSLPRNHSSHSKFYWVRLSVAFLYHWRRLKTIHLVLHSTSARSAATSASALTRLVSIVSVLITRTTRSSLWIWNSLRDSHRLRKLFLITRVTLS